jgi:hypothetical protein
VNKIDVNNTIKENLGGDGDLDENINISDEEFQNKCLEYITEINNTCDSIHNNTQGINMRSGPVVYVAKSKIINNEFDNEHKLKEKPDTDKSQPRGTSLIELMKSKQNEEIDNIIDKQISDADMSLLTKKDIEHINQDKRDLFMA